MLMSDRRDFADVNERQGGIRRRLDPDKLCLGSNKLSNVDLDARAEGDLDVVCEGDLCEVAMGASVHV